MMSRALGACSGHDPADRQRNRRRLNILLIHPASAIGGCRTS
jgi:hypothetical protein